MKILIAVLILGFSSSSFADSDINGVWSGTMTEQCSDSPLNTIDVEVRIYRNSKTAEFTIHFGGEWKGNFGLQPTVDANGNVIGRSGAVAGFSSANEIYFTKDALPTSIDLFDARLDKGGLLFTQDESWSNGSCHYTGNLNR